jgi:hypothetical protein
MIDLILGGAGIVVAVAGVLFSLVRRRDDEPAVLESGQRSSTR